MGKENHVFSAAYREAEIDEIISYCGHIISNSLEACLEENDAKSIVIMLPIGAEGTALKYAVQAIDAGLNVVTSFSLTNTVTGY